MTALDWALFWVILETILAGYQYRSFTRDNPQGTARTISVMWLSFFVLGAVVWLFLAVWYAQHGIRLR